MDDLGADGVVHLAVRVGDEHGIQTWWQLGVGWGTQHGPDVRQPLTLQPPPSGLEHDGLNVLGVDEAVGPDAAREPGREPATGNSELCNDVAFGDLERVHDQVGLLPLIAVRGLEQSKRARWKEPAAPSCGGTRAWRRQARLPRRAGLRQQGRPR